MVCLLCAFVHYFFLPNNCLKKTQWGKKKRGWGGAGERVAVKTVKKETSKPLVALKTKV